MRLQQGVPVGGVDATLARAVARTCHHSWSSAGDVAYRTKITSVKADRTLRQLEDAGFLKRRDALLPLDAGADANAGPPRSDLSQPARRARLLAPRGGADIQVVKERLGHHHITTTQPRGRSPTPSTAPSPPPQDQALLARGHPTARRITVHRAAGFVTPNHSRWTGYSVWGGPLGLLLVPGRMSPSMYVRG